MKRKTAKKSSKKRAVTDWSKELVKSVWPQERDFFERPERYRYVRRLLPADECVFCEAAKAPLGVQSLVLARDNERMVVMNKYPYNTAHLLVMPRDHIGPLWEMPDNLNLALAEWLKKSVAILKEVMKCDGFNLGLNQGQVAGAGIPNHLHWHIVPRWAGDTNFFPLIAETKALPETLEQTYNRLRPHFEKEMGS